MKNILVFIYDIYKRYMKRIFTVQVTDIIIIWNDQLTWVVFSVYTPHDVSTLLT